MTPTTFMMHSMAIDPRHSVVYHGHQYVCALCCRAPALVSTGITILYFFLKACSFIINAISNQTKRRMAMSTASGGQQEYCTDPREEGDTEICQQVQRHISENRQYGGKPERSTGTILLSRRGQNICLPSFRDDTGNTTEPTFRENEEGLPSGRYRATKGHYGQGPKDSHINATRILKECRSQDNASNEQSQCAKRNGREGSHN